MPFTSIETILFIVAFILALYSHYRIKATFKKYNKVQNSIKLTEREVVERILKNSGMEGVELRL